MRCTPSLGALDFAGPLVEGVLSQFKLLLLGGLMVSALSFGLCFGDGGTDREVDLFGSFKSVVSGALKLCC